MNERAELYKIYKDTNSSFMNEEFAKVDSILENMNVEEKSLHELLAYLTITYAAKGKLSAREDFVNRAFEFLKSKPDFKEGWIRGLK